MNRSGKLREIRSRTGIREGFRRSSRYGLDVSACDYSTIFVKFGIFGPGVGACGTLREERPRLPVLDASDPAVLVEEGGT